MKQVLYVLISSIILYIVYQLINKSKLKGSENNKNSEKSELNNEDITKSKDKLIVFSIILLICSFVIYYFNIGLDELQVDGEQKLHDLLQFEKSMIGNIDQDVTVGPVPF